MHIRAVNAVPPARAPGGFVSSCAKYLPLILSLMEQYKTRLNGVFQALADPTRRAVLTRLSKGPATVGDLAKPFDMALPSFMKHIHLLEESGWIRTRKQGRVRSCALEKKQFAAVEAWLNRQRALWEGRTDRLEAFAMAAARKETSK
jgi:DNA-binding transcriptional ArsR family regulator